MATNVRWRRPQELKLEQLLDGDPIERGRDSVEKRREEERISSELEEFSIGSEGLKDPRTLSNSDGENAKPPAIIPLETEVCPL